MLTLSCSFPLGFSVILYFCATEVQPTETKFTTLNKLHKKDLLSGRLPTCDYLIYLVSGTIDAFDLYLNVLPAHAIRMVMSYLARKLGLHMSRHDTQHTKK